MATLLPFPVPDDEPCLNALRRGDPRAWRSVVERWHGALVRQARRYVRTAELAEEVAQETWAAANVGLARFEGRSSFKVWLFRILANRARTRGEREARYLPACALPHDPAESGDEQLDRLVSRGRSDGRAAERRLIEREARQALDQALTLLPPRQRAVVELRDLEGEDSEVVRQTFGLSEANQRVLLHRGREKVRAHLGQDWLPALAG